MTVACERLVREFPGHRGSLALLLTSDEEGPATDGTVAVVEALKARGTQIDYCLIGEPSSSVRLGDTLKNGRRGSLSAHLVVKGVQGHVAYPEEVRNPIHLAAPALAELAATVWDAGNASFPPTSFQISNIKGGTGALNVVPGAVAIDFNFRFCTASTEAGLRARTCAILDRHGLDYSIDWVLGAKPFLTEEGRLVDAVQGAIHEITGQRAAVLTTGGTSDGRFICEICPELVEFGPVNRSIHKVNEFVELDCLGPLAEVYFRTLTRLLVD
jgi:succinyl-diaminopimelate desuccinylase